MENKSLKVIQLGGNPLYLDEWLTYEYVTPDEMAMAEIDEIPLLENGRINPALDAYRILVPHDSPLLDDFEFLKILPANNIVFDERIEIPAEYQQIAKLLNVQFVQMEDTEKLAEELILNFFQGQVGNYFVAKTFRIRPNFDGQVTQIGNNLIRFEQINFSDKTYLGSYAESMFVLGNQQFEFMMEYALNSPGIELFFHFKIKDANSDQFESYEIGSSDLEHGVFVSDPLYGGSYVSISVFAKGRGIVDLGHAHLRKSHNGRGFMMIGGKNELVEPDLSQEINFYFDAGDLKPPLNVYFSGFRTAPGFEGNFIMKDLGSPFILINDPRLLGGDFYIGSQKFESKIPAYIKEKLFELGFSNKDLILTGLSMGSFAALYYAADLDPIAVVVGKPLISLGTIAEESRISRPDDFAESVDMLHSWTGGTSKSDIKKANKIFWDKFKQGSFENTEFAFSYMKNDDYDQNAFLKLNTYLREYFPKVKVISKGFIGRHNDESELVVDWFMRQIKRILHQKFGRIMRK